MQQFNFPTFRQLYPYEVRHCKLLREFLRYHWRKFWCAKQCQQFVEFLNQNPLWQPLFTHCYYRINALLTKYCDRTFNAQQRLLAIMQNFVLAEKIWGREFCQRLVSEQQILLSPLNDGYKLQLGLNQIDPFEGFFALTILDAENSMIYAGSFTFLPDNQVLIASIQGPKGEQSKDLVRNATKALHGERPMFMLLNSFKWLAQHCNCTLLGIPHKRQAKYRWNDSSKLLFNYDEFWRKNHAQRDEKFFQIRTAVATRPLQDIASKKRSMYRKRYEMFDFIEENSRKVLKNDK